MDGVRWLAIRAPVSDVVDEANPAIEISCDWLGNPLIFGILIFPPHIYEAMRRANGNSSSGNQLEAAKG